MQSFLDAEAHAAGRPQRRAEVEPALGAIRDAGFPALNIDLIYGIAGQTAPTWRDSLRRGAAWRPEEIYLYPLYVRPLTGLGRRRAAPTGTTTGSPSTGRAATTCGPPATSSCRCAMFRLPRTGAGRGRTTAARTTAWSASAAAPAPTPRRCTTRSTTRSAPARCGRSSTTTWPPADDFAVAEVGFRLDEDEQRRRWLVKSLLRAEGLDPAAYRARSAPSRGRTSARSSSAWPSGAGWTRRRRRDGRWLTAEGLAHSDAIGPWLVSGRVRELMAGYVPR